MSGAGWIAPVALVTGLVLLEYFFFTLLVARARARGKVQAPAVTGDEHFERCYRVQQNTIERLVVVLPSMWLFGLLIDGRVAAGIGLVFIVGRYVYMRGYVADPSKRGLGFGIGFIAEATLLLGALGGAILTYFR